MLAFSEFFEMLGKYAYFFFQRCGKKIMKNPEKKLKHGKKSYLLVINKKYSVMSMKSQKNYRTFVKIRIYPILFVK